MSRPALFSVQVTLHPTPDTQGPAGLAWHGASGKILAFMPPVGGSWQLVAIDPVSGLVEPTTGLNGVPPMHGRLDGATWLLTQGGQTLLNAGFFTAMGAPCQMLAIDVGCALKRSPHANCTVSSSPWPPDPMKTSAPEDLAIDEGRHGALY